MIRLACAILGLCALVIGGGIVLILMQGTVVRLARIYNPELFDTGVLLLVSGAVLYYIGKKSEP
jgi:hypothetical protein